MAPPKPLIAAPASFLAYAIGWWGIAHGQGVAGSLLPFLWILAYYGVFWGGWAAIPLLGVGATFGGPLLPERWRGPARALFVGWLVAWLAVWLAQLWLGPPPGFQAVGL